MNRRNGTCAGHVLVTYRELSPGPELRGLVRAFYSFGPGAAPWRGRHALIREVQFTTGESFCSPLFADGRASLVVHLGAACSLQAGWTRGTPLHAQVIGPLRVVGAPAGTSHSEMVGAYFEPGAMSALLQVAPLELTDRVVHLDELWGASGARLAEDLADLDEAGRIARLEATLIERVRRARASRLRIDVSGLTRWLCAEATSITVGRLADAAGVSRQHLTRVFRQAVGVSPKRYCRLARFHTALVHTGAGSGVDWADVAAELGYADQSHMIAEFRELSSLTPQALATGKWFHPFILEAQSRGRPDRARQ